MRKHNKKAKRNILLELLKKTYINKSDVAFVANEVEDIQKQKDLNYKKSAGTITPEEEQLLGKLNKKYGVVGKDNNKKSHGNKMNR